ncbi:phage tail tape measure protein [Paracoccus aerius]|uniref:Phage tail tape measure protein n=1 Tax=Paracoccus aerius TaxID=1915382 RepID=A0ABS1S100_9RHOB|nr:phage tail tape measure protein [Paracoccus aerius]MBL3672255.1 phage tail tape measure protein [Paracoccus aerius]GHG11321.1 hypothetical protein GCM10017322_03530 [Paracoccus aerius]
MAKTLQSQLILSLVDRVTAPARGIQAQMDRLNSRIAATNERASQIGSKLVTAAAQATGFALAMAQPVRAAMDLESAMADVRKVVDFPTPEAFRQFQDELVQMSTELPIAVTGLAEIAAAAGQAGIAGADLTRFTREAAQIGVAFDISAGEAGDAMAKMMTGLDLTIDEVVSLSDAMNHLSNAQASSAAQVLDVVRRAGAQGRQYGYTAEQTAAFASAMISAGAESDVAATSFMNMGRALTRGTSATKRQNAAYSQLGLNASDVAKRMQEDAVGTTVDVMERLSQLPKEMQAAISSDLFGDEARALGPLLTNLSLVHDSVGMVADQSLYAGSSLAEFRNRMKTFGATVQTFRNRLNALSIALGETLFPILTQVMEQITPIIVAIRDWIRINPELTARIIAVTGALISLRVALLALRFAGLTGRAGVLNLLALGMGTIGRAGASMAGAVGESIRLRCALAKMDGSKVGLIDKIGAGLRGLAGVTGLTAVSQGLAAVGAVIAGISAPVWLGVAVAVGAVGLAWKYWDRVSAIVSGVGAAISEKFAPVMEKLEPILKPLSPVIEDLGEAFAFVDEKIRAAAEFARNLVGGLFTREILTEGEQADLRARASKMTSDLIDYFAALPGKLLTIGSEMIQKLWDGMEAKFSGLLERVKAMADEISGPWRSILSGGRSDQPDLGTYNPATGTFEQAKAVGGHMRGRVPTLVGERGPEIVYPSRAGWVAHANQAKRLADLSRRARPSAMPSRSAPSQGSRPMNVTFGNIIVQGGANASARDISREIGREVQAELRGTFTDPY